MDSQRTSDRVSITAYGDDAADVRRIASMMPALTANGIGLRALRAGLRLVERELREAAARLVDNYDAENL